MFYPFTVKSDWKKRLRQLSICYKYWGIELEEMSDFGRVNKGVKSEVGVRTHSYRLML